MTNPKRQSTPSPTSPPPSTLAEAERVLADHARQIREQRSTEDADLSVRLGRAIRQIRENRIPLRSQQQMAAALGITQTGYSRYESGVVPLTVPALVRICGVLDVRVNDVLTMVLGGAMT